MGEGLYRCPKQAPWQEEGRTTLHLSNWLLEQKQGGAIRNDAGWQGTPTSLTALLDWAAAQSTWSLCSIPT